MTRHMQKLFGKSKMDAEQKEFIKEKIAEANWLKNALQKAKRHDASRRR